MKLAISLSLLVVGLSGCALSCRRRGGSPPPPPPPHPPSRLPCIKGSIHHSSFDVFKKNSVTHLVRAKLPFTFDEIEILCDGHTLGGGWIVFQRRWEGKQDFYQDWYGYKNGFGRILGDFWWGLEKVYKYTKDKKNCAMFIIMNFNGKYYFQEFKNFRIDPESKNYTLHYGEHKYYGPPIFDALAKSNHQPFSTFDHGRDQSGAKKCGGGWWFTGNNTCTDSMLNDFTRISMGWRWGKNQGKRYATYSQMSVRC